MSHFGMTWTDPNGFRDLDWRSQHPAARDAVSADKFIMIPITLEYVGSIHPFHKHCLVYASTPHNKWDLPKPLVASIDIINNVQGLKFQVEVVICTTGAIEILSFMKMCGRCHLGQSNPSSELIWAVDVVKGLWVNSYTRMLTINLEHTQIIYTEIDTPLITI